MNRFHAVPLPDVEVFVADLRLFHNLAVQAMAGHSVDYLLQSLAEYLGFDSLHLCRPLESPPDMQRTIVLPLMVGNYTFGDLYASVPDSVDRLTVAARLAFFSSVIALCAAANIEQRPV